MEFLEERVTDHAEDRKPPKMVHYQHPTDPTKMWCGMKRTPSPIGKPGDNGFRYAECVVCSDLWHTYGTLGWLCGVS